MLSPRRRKARIHARKQQKKRRNEASRHFVLSGLYSLTATIGIYIIWRMGYIPVTGDAFLIVVFGGIGFGIGLLIASRFKHE